MYLHIPKTLRITLNQLYLNSIISKTDIEYSSQNAR